ncbi:MAG: dihydroorotate dehydrogenase [Armatimonadetes bacterium]|nr:dihydroorotate dehydrogenase [Armatimonadota bacterium]
MNQPNLSVSIGAMTMRNPVMAASGVFGYGEEFRGLADYGELGALVLKTVTKEPRVGNPPACRTVETPAGMVNAIGLENVGVEAFAEEKLPSALAYGTNVVASIAGDEPEDFAHCARILDATQVAAIEINISCPNVKRGGMSFGVDPVASAEVVSAVRGATSKVIMPKLTPNVTDIASVATACEKAGADTISLTNTFSAMVIDVEKRCPLLAAGIGGLSGPAIRPAAVYRVYQVAQSVSIPVVGMGGIWNANDALEFILAGATAVQIGTVLYADPAAGHRIMDGIRDYLTRHDLRSVSDVVGVVSL